MLKYILVLFLANLQKVKLEDSIHLTTNWVNQSQENFNIAIPEGQLQANPDRPRPSLLDVFFFIPNYERRTQSFGLFGPKASLKSNTTWKCWAQAITFLRPKDNVTIQNNVAAFSTVLIFGIFAILIQIEYGEITLSDFSILLIKTCLFVCGLVLTYDFIMFNVYISDCSNTIEYN